MTATVDRAPRASTRVVSAAPVGSPDAFMRSVQRISGRQPVTDGMAGFAGRNDNWLVPTAEGPELFVKQLRGTRRDVLARLARIEAFEGLVAGRPPTEYRTAPYHGIDRDQGLVVFGCLPDTRAASELLAADELDPACARRFGRILAEVHSLGGSPAPAGHEAAEAHDANRFYALTVDGYANCSGGEVEAWAMLQHDKVLVQALSQLRALSQAAPSVASHCDVRLDQFLLAGDDVYVIDWEEFRHTDPARDLGGLIGEFLHTAAHRMFAELDVPAGLAPGAAHEAILRSGEHQLTRLREHIREVWLGYLEVGDVDPGLSTRTTAYAGWHFFDRLLAGAAHGAKLTAGERGMAGIGRNALVDPSRYATTIGLDGDQA